MRRPLTSLLIRVWLLHHLRSLLLETIPTVECLVRVRARPHFQAPRHKRFQARRQEFLLSMIWHFQAPVPRHFSPQAPAYDILQ